MSPITVTATQSGGSVADGTGLTVRVVTGAAYVQNGATTVSGTVTVPEASITPHNSGSLIYGAVGSDGALTIVPAANTTFFLNQPDAPNQLTAVTYRLTGPTTSTSPVTVGGSGPTETSGTYFLAMAEILGVGEMQEDASSPASVYSNSAESVTTAPFSPPPGSLLVAICSVNTTGGGVDSITMSNSGTGLTWTQLVIDTTLGIEAIYIARVPGPVPVQLANNAGNSSASLAVTVSTTAGNNMTATITAWMTGNNPIAISSITDSAGNKWRYSTAQNNQNPPTSGVYDAADSLYAFTASAVCLTADNNGQVQAVTSVTVTFTTTPTSWSEMGVMEWFGIPLGVVIQAASTNAIASNVSSYTTPSVTTTSPALTIVTTSDINGEFTGVNSPFTIINTGDTISAYAAGAGPGSISATLTQSPSDDVPGSTILTLSLPPVYAVQFSSATPFTQVTAAGNTVILVFTGYNNANTAMSTSLPTLGGVTPANAFKAFDSQAAYDSVDGEGQICSIWVLPNVPAGQTTFGLTITGGSQINLAAIEVFGLGLYPSIDQLALYGTPASPPLTVDSGPTKPSAVQYEIAIAVSGSYGGINGLASEAYWNYIPNGTHQSYGYVEQITAGQVYEWQQVTFGGAGGANVLVLAPTGPLTPQMPVLRRPPGRRNPMSLRALPYTPPPPPSGSSAIGVADVGGADDAVTLVASVPTADVAGAIEGVVVGAAVPEADVAGADDSFGLTAVALPQPDVAGADDAQTVAAAVPEADVAGAIDAFGLTAVSLPQPDVAGADEKLAATVTAPGLADVAGADDAPLIAAAVPVADVGGAADTLPVAAAVPVADVAGADDAFSVLIVVPTAEGDVAGADDSFSVVVTVGLADVGGSAQNEADVTTVALPDVAGAADAETVTAAVPVAEVAGAADKVTAAAAVPLAEVAGADDALAVSAAVGLADVAGADDSITAAAASAPALPDVAAGDDSITITVSVGLADVGGAVESETSGSPVSISDAAGAADALGATAATPAGDTAGAADSASVAVSAPLHEVAAAVEAVAVAVSVNLADVGAEIDAYANPARGIFVSDQAGAEESAHANAVLAFYDEAAAEDRQRAISDSWKSGTVKWLARPRRQRWEADPDTDRWRAEAEAERWEAEAVEARWQARAAHPRWGEKGIIVSKVFKPISALSLAEVNVSWSSWLAGTSIDPTGQTPSENALPVQMAFPLSSGNVLAPAQPVTWYNGSWLVVPNPQATGYIAQCLVGPVSGVLQLASGLTYDVWSQILGTPEAPVQFVGQLPVY